jgi:hypothetical protein
MPGQVPCLLSVVCCLSIGYRLLAIGYWLLLAIGYWLLAVLALIVLAPRCSQWPVIGYVGGFGRLDLSVMQKRVSSLNKTKEGLNKTPVAKHAPIEADARCFAPFPYLHCGLCCAPRVYPLGSLRGPRARRRVARGYVRQ